MSKFKMTQKEAQAVVDGLEHYLQKGWCNFCGHNDDRVGHFVDCEMPEQTNLCPISRYAKAVRVTNPCDRNEDYRHKHALKFAEKMLDAAGYYIDWEN